MQKILKFLSEVRTEFKNISWPKRDSLIQLTIVVISISIIVSLILGGFDFAFTQGFNLVGQTKVTSAKKVVPTGIQSILESPTPLPSTPSAATPTIKKTK